MAQDGLLDLLGKEGIGCIPFSPLAHMALSRILKDERVTTVLIGASKPEQVTDSIQSLANISFTQEELNTINQVLA